MPDLLFVSVKDCIACVELWANEDIEMISVEEKRSGPKYTFEIVDIYRAPSKWPVAVILGPRTDYLGIST